MRRLLTLLPLLLLILAAGCEPRGGIVIESMATPPGLAMTDATGLLFAADLAALEQPPNRVSTPDDASAVQAVRTGLATAALVRSDAAPADGLESVELLSRTAGLFVPFTLPVEGVTAAQARALFAGEVRSWSEVGGPNLSVEASVRRPAEVAAILGFTPAAREVEDVAATLGSRAGMLAIATGTGIGAATKALRVDGLHPADAGYPFAARWALVTKPGNSHGAVLARSLLARRGAAQPEVVLDAVGDIMLGRDVGKTIAAKGVNYPFEAVTPLFAGSDVRFGNLELALTERGQAARKDYVFRAPPSTVEGLRTAGFSILALANNHTLDYGTQGLLDTVDALERAGIAHVGAGKDVAAAHAPRIVEVRGLRLAFLSYVNTPNDSLSGWQAESMRAGPATPGAAWGTPEVIKRDVTAAKAQADLVIVAIHAGFEYISTLSSMQRSLAFAAVDAGAALVLGAHPHVLQGIEFYKGVPVVYSLGNFVFDLDSDDHRQPGLPSILTGVLRLRLTRDGVTGMEFRPAVIDVKEGRPVPVQGAAARPVFDRLYSLTNALRAAP